MKKDLIKRWLKQKAVAVIVQCFAMMLMMSNETLYGIDIGKIFMFFLISVFCVYTFTTGKVWMFTKRRLSESRN